MTHPALTQLIWSLFRGSLRRVLVKLKSPATAILTLIAIGLVASGAAPAIAMNFIEHDPIDSPFQTVLTLCTPVLLYVAVVLLVLGDGGDALLELRPAELQFVLAGPFSDTQILSYRLSTLLLNWIPVSVLMATFLLTHFASFVGAVLGIFFGGTLVTLISLQYTLLKPRLSPAWLHAVRIALLLGLAGIAAESLIAHTRSVEAYSLETVATWIAHGHLAQLLSLPFQPIATMLFQTSPVVIAQGALLASVTVLVLLATLYRTNAGFSELAVAGVARKRQKLERLRSGNLHGSPGGLWRSRFSLPDFPWWTGAGPVAWNQILQTLRRSGRILQFFLVIAGLAAGLSLIAQIQYPGMIPETVRQYALLASIGAAGYVGFLLTLPTQLGFAAPDRILTLFQTLPVRATALAAGMAAGLFSLLATLQLGFVLPALTITSQSFGECLTMVALALTTCLALASAANLVSAVTGLRAAPTGTPDILHGVRVIAYMLVFGLIVTPLLLFAVGAAATAAALFGFAIIPCAAAATGTLLALLPVIWWMTGQRFLMRELETDT